MLAKKILLLPMGLIVLALVLLISGCTPPATRALRDGQRLIEAGQYEKAIEQLQLATSLAKTNDAAWNYLGLAYHRAGRLTNAVSAYQQAIRLNRDLMEARFNLGCLWLEAKRYEPARDAFTSCTVLRPNDTEAWLKRGTAELRLRDLPAAENSFREVLKLAPQHPEALNSLGLVQLQRNRPRDAAQQFALAVKAQPDYAPALLNLATVTYQQLNDRATGVKYYRDYLALNPRPADFDAVQRLVQSLEPVASAPAVRLAVTNNVATTAAPVLQKTSAVVAPPRATTSPPPATVAVSAKPVAPSPASIPAAGIVTLPPEPEIRSAGEVSTDARKSAVPPTISANSENGSAPKSGQKSFLAKINPVNLFRSESKSEPKVTPLPVASSAGASSASPMAKSSAPINAPLESPKPVAATDATAWSRYSFSAPERFPGGDRTLAEQALAKGRALLQSNRLREARPYLDQAVQTDPSWFDARFAQAFAAMQARDYRTALFAWERALMLDPKSRAARYNFALTLKAANYPLDAAAQLEQVLGEDPNDVRAHLALGNIYAETLRDRARARVHYARVIELNPQHPQSTEIRYWLLSNDT